MVIWLIGLAGAGKTSIGKALYRLERSRRTNVVFFDGDHFRTIMGDDLGHTIEDRWVNAWRICRLCQYLDSQGIDVVCAILSLFHETQAWNRLNLKQYFEVYVDVPMDVLIQRDQKGLYSSAIGGRIRNVVGVDIPFKPPPSADLVIDNSRPTDSFVPLARRILDRVDEKFQ